MQKPPGLPAGLFACGGTMNVWEYRALTILRNQAQESYISLSINGTLSAVTHTLARAAMDRYATMVSDGINADTAWEINMAQMAEELLGHDCLP
jgi:hypothetical protein